MDGCFFLITIISPHNLTLHLSPEIHKTIFIVHLARFSVAVWGATENYYYFCATITPKHYGREYGDA